MSDFCSKFAAEKNTIMEKRTYIQPEVDTMVVPKDALMDPIILAGSGEGPTLAPTWRPKNPTRTPVF